MNLPVYLYITPFFPSADDWRGGYCYDAVKALQRLGKYDVRVLKPGAGLDYEYGGVKVCQFASYQLPCGLLPFLNYRRNVRSFVRKLAEIGIAASQVKVCHCHVLECAPYAVAFKRLNPDALTLLHHHSISMVNLRSGRLGVILGHATLLYFYYRWLCERIDAHVFVSEKSRHSYARVFRTTPESEFVDLKDTLLFGWFFRPFKVPRSFVFYNGYDPELYHPALNARHDVSSFTIGCVANFQPLKDHLTLLKAVVLIRDKIPNLKVKLVGSGETKPMCEQFVRERGLEQIVEFLPEVDHVHMPDFYRSLDLFVLPSRLEGFCCAFVEAAACGVPVIGCKTISLAEVVPEEQQERWLMDPLDAKGLSERIVSCCQQRVKFAFNRSLDINELWHDFVERIS